MELYAIWYKLYEDGHKGIRNQKAEEQMDTDLNRIKIFSIAK